MAASSHKLHNIDSLGRVDGGPQVLQKVQQSDSLPEYVNFIIIIDKNVINKIYPNKMIDTKEFSKLSPEARLRKLKQMEEERKKEVDEIGQLIKKSMQDIRTDRLAGEIAPEQKAVDISRLFEKENGGKLEKTARQSDKRPGPGNYQAVTQVYQAYSQLSEFYGIVAGGSGLTQEQLKAIGQIGERLNVAERYMTESERTSSKLDAGKAVLYKLRKATGLE